LFQDKGIIIPYLKKYATFLLYTGLHFVGDLATVNLMGKRLPRYLLFSLRSKPIAPCTSSTPVPISLNQKVCTSIIELEKCDQPTSMSGLGLGIASGVSFWTGILFLLSKKKLLTFRP